MQSFQYETNLGDHRNLNTKDHFNPQNVSDLHLCCIAMKILCQVASIKLVTLFTIYCKGLVAKVPSAVTLIIVAYKI